MRARIVHCYRLIGLSLILMLCVSVGMTADPAKAHNNPGFKEVLLITIDVSNEPLSGDDGGAYSLPFTLDLPKKTIELIWRIDGDGSEGVAFAVAQGGKLHAEGLTSDSTSRILRGGDIRIIDVQGAQTAFRLKVFANVIDRSQKADS